ncbi:putative calcium-binding protein CML43 [Morus notabilis]|uniref:Putative calcium-binding protein CML43 n=1 Tax=Morus notabilis TaxID=981085 RepID=W9SA04_9ROSA|nr:probable calcium-binding protein CML43 [Morus notabilis]EXC32775.1 putative calcium-binding protein CML43 [Morus notabilis]
MGITETCSRLLGDLVHAIGGSSRSMMIGSETHTLDEQNHQACKRQKAGKVDDSMARALITVFGMQNDGRIHKEKARKVVEKLGLIRVEEAEVYDDKSSAQGFDLPGDYDGVEEVPVEEVLDGEELMENSSKRSELLHQAFKIFDENGNGFIEAVELKRVLECLGLDCGWGMDEIEKMLRVVDLNLDGKVDFGEFEFMMGMNSHS